MERSSETILVILVIIALVLTAINAFVALRQIADIARVTGYQVQDPSGRVNLSIPTAANIRFNVSIIDWKNGTVNTLGGFDSANLSTSNTPNASKVVGGTWDPNVATNTVTGLLLLNIGNVNLSVQLNSNINARNYLCGGSPCGAGAIPEPKFEWNVTEYEPGACGGGTGNINGNINVSYRGIFGNVSTTNPFICGNGTATTHFLKPGLDNVNDGATNPDNANTLRIDFFIEVPRDAPTGGKTAIITATGTFS